MAKLFLVHWAEEEAQAWAQELMALGWTVGVAHSNSGQAYRDVRDIVPDVVVVSLEEKSDWGLQTAEAVRATRWGRELPFIFVGGEDDDALLTLRQDFPEASYVEYDELPAALESHKGAHD